jgi:hypothetical protein
MQCNVGRIDQVIRIVLGFLLMAMFFLVESPLKWVSIVGAVLLVTGVVRFCPLYRLIGIDTCKTK